MAETLKDLQQSREMKLCVVLGDAEAEILKSFKQPDGSFVIPDLYVPVYQELEKIVKHLHEVHISPAVARLLENQHG